MNEPVVQQACAALRAGRLLQVMHEGARQRLEVHAVGYSRSGRAVAWVWRLTDAEGERAGWKTVNLEAASDARVCDELSEAPRRGYRRGRPSINRIVCEL